MTNHDIYHITHVDNLVTREERLWSDAQRIARRLANTNVGYSHIKARRMRRPVTVAASGVLEDYVPFNFCPRSVMSYVVSQGHENYREGQQPIIHLASSIQTISATGRPWLFTDRHADLGYANQFDTRDNLDKVDWSVMPLRQWGGDQEVKEKRQAEFLVHDWCPWSVIEIIGVIDQRIAARVKTVIAGADHKPRVEVHRDWYY
ncbi:MAG: type II toxin-antitoxin system toxin DNA ADP-ribosyl transferase DarT [Gammaproteobacteria bacterium]